MNSTAQPTIDIELVDWALARGLTLPESICLFREVRRESVQIGAKLISQARDRRLRAIDRALASHADELGKLYRRGLDEAEKIRRERTRHKLKIVKDGRWPITYLATCACGEWKGSERRSRQGAELDVKDEREVLDRWAGHRSALTEAAS